MSDNSSEFTLLSVQSKKIIQKTEKALRRHIRLIKKRERITTVVATLEKLKGSLRDEDIVAVRKYIKRLDQLTKGFAQRALTSRTTHRKN